MYFRAYKLCQSNMYVQGINDGTWNGVMLFEAGLW